MFTVRPGHPPEDSVGYFRVGGATARLCRLPTPICRMTGGRAKRRGQYPDPPGGWGCLVPCAQSGQRLERELQ